MNITKRFKLEFSHACQVFSDIKTSFAARKDCNGADSYFMLSQTKPQDLLVRALNVNPYAVQGGSLLSRQFNLFEPLRRQMRNPSVRNWEDMIA